MPEGETSLSPSLCPLHWSVDLPSQISGPPRSPMVCGLHGHGNNMGAGQVVWNRRGRQDGALEQKEVKDG
jgi:hypothetical protein